MERTLVCPHDAELLSHIRNRAVVVTAEGIDNALRFGDEVVRTHELYCMWCNEKRALTDVLPNPENVRIPLALSVEEVGDLTKIFDYAALYAGSRIRVYFPASHKRNITDVRILASLGVHCGFTFDGPSSVDWDALNDLMVYSVYNSAPHAEIEPFASVIRRYDPTKITYILSSLFENPGLYFHVDKDRHIAATHEQLINRQYLGTGLEDLADLEQTFTEIDAEQACRELFIDNAPCATCEAFRICVGTFRKACASDTGCRDLMKELLEACDYRYTKNIQQVWQP
jgi:hypothetical protein